MAKKSKSAAVLAQCKKELSECAARFRKDRTRVSQEAALIADRLGAKSMDGAWLQIEKSGLKPVDFVVMVRDALADTGRMVVRQQGELEQEAIDRVRTALHRLRAATNLALKDGALPGNRGRTVEITGVGCRPAVACFGWGDMDEASFRTFYPLDLLSIVELYEEMLADHVNEIPARIGRLKKGLYPPKVGVFIRHMAKRMGGTHPATLAAVANTLFYWNKARPVISKQTANAMARSGGGVVHKRKTKC